MHPYSLVNPKSSKSYSMIPGMELQAEEVFVHIAGPLGLYPHNILPP